MSNRVFIQYSKIHSKILNDKNIIAIFWGERLEFWPSIYTCTCNCNPMLVLSRNVSVVLQHDLKFSHYNNGIFAVVEIVFKDQEW